MKFGIMAGSDLLEGMDKAIYERGQGLGFGYDGY